MSPVKHVFVLMMENRSFDNIFGYSGISGWDARTRVPTVVEDLTSRDGSNVDPTTGKVWYTSPSAPYVVPSKDIEHEFLDIMRQLCGPKYVPASGPVDVSAYPPVDNSGFIADYVEKYGNAFPDEPLRCFDPSDLPILMTLAREFAICDHWFAAVPGPTWPNRFWVHGASPTTERLANSPSSSRIMSAASGVSHFWYANGTIYDRLAAKGLRFKAYTDSPCNQVCSTGTKTTDLEIDRISDFVTERKR